MAEREKSSEPVLGIIGGMGPEATVALMARIIKRTPAHDDAEHMRMLVDNNPKVPSRIKHLVERTGVDPGPVLAGMARGLEKQGADLLAIPCNTAHHYIAAMRAAVRIPVLDMIDLSLDRVAATPQVTTIGLLASPAVRITKLFDARAAARGCRVMFPDEAHEPAVLAIIRAVKAGNVEDAHRRFYLEAVEHLRASGAQRLIIACTELSLIPLPTGLQAITLDTLDVLVDAILEYGKTTAPEFAGAQ